MPVFQPLRFVEVIVILLEENIKLLMGMFPKQGKGSGPPPGGSADG